MEVWTQVCSSAVNHLSVRLRVSMMSPHQRLVLPPAILYESHINISNESREETRKNFICLGVAAKTAQLAVSTEGRLVLLSKGLHVRVFNGVSVIAVAKKLKVNWPSNSHGKIRANIS